jgi:hypothetical protein
MDSQRPSNLTNALGHAGQANSPARTIFSKALQNCRRYTAAIVSHPQDHVVACRLQTDIGSFRPGMPVHIRQAFLQHPE